MNADKIKDLQSTSVEIGTKRAKKGTNLSLSDESLKMVKELKRALKRPSITNVVETLIHETYETAIVKKILAGAHMG